MISIKGFKGSGIHSGIKKNGKKDLGLIYAESPAMVSAVFTKNLVKAAPVQIGMEKVKSGYMRALLINSGNANASTGKQGLIDASKITNELARRLNVDDSYVIPSSTGVIGKRLPTQKIINALPNLIKKLSGKGFKEVATSIMTTDKFPKYAYREFKIGRDKGKILAVAKGAGMICPDMATMLCFLITDIKLSKGVMNKALRNSVEKSFNKITVDGDTSTNDTVFLMSSGNLENSDISINRNSFRKFEDTLVDLNNEIAEMIVKDGEGATKVVKIVVKGTKTVSAADKIARAIGTSSLVKTAFFGQDANWGRIIAAAGRSGINFNPDKVELLFDKVTVYKNGVQYQPESKFSHIFRKPNFTITLKINDGKESSHIITSDLSLDYVKLNSDYRT